MEKRSIEFKLGLNGLVKGFLWKSEPPYKGVVLICHGMAEHIKRYDHFASFLSSKGYIIFGYDQRGHGQSVENIDKIGYMSDIDNFQILVNDVGEITRYIKERFSDLPIYLFGHSMGSFVAQRYIEDFGTSINGVILSGSNLNKGLKLYFGALIAKIVTILRGRKHRSKLIHNLVFGRYNDKYDDKRTDFDWLSRDHKIVDDYIKDEKCGTIFTAAFFKDFFKGLIRIYRYFELIPINLPILIVSGDKDPVGEYGKGVIRLYNELKKSGAKNVEYKLYPEARHELLNETNKEEVYSDILNWLDEQHNNMS
ncbi:MAG TPA: alpha/beta hydrolase [Acholeplasmataceae bacterium]|nr:alpha/beta hydrolase [Acholeplasmataceae bacterium]